MTKTGVMICGHGSRSEAAVDESDLLTTGAVADCSALSELFNDR